MSDADALIIDRRQPGWEEAPPASPSRRTMDRAVSIRQLAGWTTMDPDFFLSEIEKGEIKGVKFGSRWRVPILDACRYLESKGFPIPADLDCWRAEEEARDRHRRRRAAR